MLSRSFEVYEVYQHFNVCITDKISSCRVVKKMNGIYSLQTSPLYSLSHQFSDYYEAAVYCVVIKGPISCTLIIVEKFFSYCFPALFEVELIHKVHESINYHFILMSYDILFEVGFPQIHVHKRSLHYLSYCSQWQYVLAAQLC